MKNQRTSLKPPSGGNGASPSQTPSRPAGSNPDRRAPRRPTQPSSSAPSSSPPPHASSINPTPPSSSFTTAATAAAPPQRSKSPVFWGAVDDAALFRGPLGETVGVVPQGTVLLEASRHRDAFGGWWISTRCDDGTLGWISYSDRSTADGGGENGNAITAGSLKDPAPSAASPLWKRVYDTRATPAPADRQGNASFFDPAANLPDTTMDPCYTNPVIDVAAIAELERKHFLFQEAEVFNYYWSNVADKEAHRDWNGEYQRAVEELRMKGEVSASKHTPEMLKTARQQLESFLAEFRAAVTNTVMRVCQEAVVPTAQRHVLSFPANSETVFFDNGIVVKRCVDDADGTLGGDEGAVKVANTMYRNHELIALEAPKHLLYTPLQSRCTFGGYTFLCSTIPPYGVDNLVCASPCSTVTGSNKKKKSAALEGQGVGAAVHVAPPSAPPLVAELMKSLADAFSLGGSELPWEWCVYAGRDRRLYVSHAWRLLPPVLPLLCGVKHSRRGSAGTGSHATPASPPQPAADGTSKHQEGVADVTLYPELLKSHIRPEVFFNWPSKWPANAHCRDCGEESARSDCMVESTAATVAVGGTSSAASPSAAVGEWIRSDGITRVAGVAGFFLPLAAPSMPVVLCKSCTNTIDADEIRFVVCANSLQCCRICIQCYTKLVMDDVQQEESGDVRREERLSRTCSAAVQCGGGCRKAGSFIMEPSVSTLLHAHGINLRYLPYVLHRLPLPSRPAVEHFFHVELVARAAKYVLQQDLRRTTTAAEAREACTTVLSALLQPNGAVSERFWRTRLGPVLQAHFSAICEPFQVSVHALRAVAERAQALTGVWLSEECLNSLDLLAAPISTEDASNRKTAATADDVDRPFVEVVAITPRTWVFPLPPRRADDEGGEVHNSGRSAVVSPLRRRLESILLFWIGHTPEGADDHQQPFYLEESLFDESA